MDNFPQVGYLVNSKTKLSLSSRLQTVSVMAIIKLLVFCRLITTNLDQSTQENSREFDINIRLQHDWQSTDSVRTLTSKADYKK